MSGKTFINLPVKDLNKSIEFFSALGFEFDRRFTDENATCMVLGADSYAMLLVEPFFQQFTGKKLVDAADSTEAIVTILLDSRQQVDELVDKALAAGAGKVNDPYVEEGMYGRSFSDLDGHQWEAVHMDMAAMEG
ncbi:VOC family protein [Saccharopolyspora rectivirgula]|uniref:VOC domain-containing protein n=1 Tax=Saccharopolyspora rectivirgula TaxID=28042 RepID=A0A073B395_9PSEU|nr:VOC family protein [Saccharopolyspora rectivirgula]KEI45712.1 hypothetical protein GU90_02090 [Saccharopolyspora rectivirgula]